MPSRSLRDKGKEAKNIAELVKLTPARTVGKEESNVIRMVRKDPKD